MGNEQTTAPAAIEDREYAKAAHMPNGQARTLKLIFDSIFTICRQSGLICNGFV